MKLFIYVPYVPHTYSGHCGNPSPSDINTLLGIWVVLNVMWVVWGILMFVLKVIRKQNFYYWYDNFFFLYSLTLLIFWVLFGISALGAIVGKLLFN